MKSKDNFWGSMKDKSTVKQTKNLVKGAVTVAVALPLLGALTGMIGGNK